MQNLDELKKKHAELGEAIKRYEEQQRSAVVNKARMFIPAKGNRYVTVSQNCIGEYNSWGYHHTGNNKVSPVFRNDAHANAIAFARSIEDQMRAQQGCVEAADGVEQWVVMFTCGNLKGIASSMTRLDLKLEFGQWGVFDTEENIDAAIAAVGVANLTRAAKAKVGIY